MDCATNSFPVPVSPFITTDISEGAINSIWRCTICDRALVPTIKLAVEEVSIFGFLISFYIYNKKKKKKKMICPMRSNCETVIHSDYSHIVGIPVEVLGMVYYAFIGIAYTASFIFDLWQAPVAMILLGVSMCSVLFSVYLVSLQMFIIRHMCTWCLLSALISLSILVLSFLHLISYPI